MTMTAETAWAHLPNAKHIDAVLADARKRPGAWDAARDAARVAALDAAWVAAWDAAGYAARAAARDVARDVARDAALDAARVVAWDAVAALVTWDSSADLLDCTPDVLRTMIDLAPEPVNHQAVLLLPWAIVKHTEEVTPM